MRVTFYGAVRTTTGSMHHLEVRGCRLLLDCGLFQGKRKEAFERNRHFPFDPASIDQVILSHAHIDHCGNLPTLVKKGFRGRILATPATRDLCDIMLRDSASLQVRDVEYVNKQRVRQGKNPFEPLYTPEDIDATIACFQTVGYESMAEVMPGVKATFHEAGHILGSGLVTLDLSENGSSKRLFFTGDMGRRDMPILRDPVEVSDVDVMLTESTYGDRLHPPKVDVANTLAELVNGILASRGKLIIPAFSVGRTQQVVYFLRELNKAKLIPCIPVFVDSPLSTKATEVYEKHEECYDSETRALLQASETPFDFHGLKYVTDVEDSKKLNHIEGPVIIISASGMCEGGRILHHLKNSVEDERNTVLIVGYQAENTLGRRIVERDPFIKIFGERYALRARVKVINALSGHADRNELLAYFNGMNRKPARSFIVHGEMSQAEPFAAAMRDGGFQNVVIPEFGQAVDF